MIGRKWHVVFVLTRPDGTETRDCDWLRFWTAAGARRRADGFAAELARLGLDLPMQFHVERTP